MRACACTVRVLYEDVCADCVVVCVGTKKKTKKKTVHSNATATAETDLMEGTDFWRQNTKKERLPSAHPRNGTSSPCWNFQELTLICCVLSCFAAGSLFFFLLRRLSLLTSYGEKDAADPTARTLTERRKFVPDCLVAKREVERMWCWRKGQRVRRWKRRRRRND